MSTGRCNRDEIGAVIGGQVAGRIATLAVDGRTPHAARRAGLPGRARGMALPRS